MEHRTLCVTEPEDEMVDTNQLVLWHPVCVTCGEELEFDQYRVWHSEVDNTVFCRATGNIELHTAEGQGS